MREGGEGGREEGVIWQTDLDKVWREGGRDRGVTDEELADYLDKVWREGEGERERL